jgi:hypothetical protein
MSNRVLVPAALLFVLAGGCVSVAHPPRFDERAGLSHERIRATPWKMYGLAPRAYDSSIGRIEHEVLDLEVDDALDGRYSEVSRITAPTVGAELLCAHEPEGHAYPPGLRAPPASVFACGGRVGADDFALDIDRGCRRGDLVFGTERFTIDRGNVEVAGAAFPSGEASVRDARGGLVAAFDVTTEMQMQVWVGPQHRTMAILAAAAIHDWTTRASAARLDACR